MQLLINNQQILLPDLRAVWQGPTSIALGDVARQKVLESKAEVDFDLETLPEIRCRPQQIGAVLSNLLRNAAAAFDGKGRITVVTRARDDEVLLEVRDDGRGISPERLARVFEPTFHVEGARVATTNWGLFVCRAIVTEHGGALEIESRENEGTVARISLPVRRVT